MSWRCLSCTSKLQVVESWGQIVRGASLPGLALAGMLDSSSCGLLVRRAVSSSRLSFPWAFGRYQLTGFFPSSRTVLLVFFLLVQDSSPVPLPTFLVAGGSLAFGTLLCVGIVLR